MANSHDINLPIYLYRRKGQDAFASCDLERFEELSAHHLFETKIAYAAPVAQDELVEALPDECPLGYGHGGKWCGPHTNCWLDPRSKEERALAQPAKES